MAQQSPSGPGHSGTLHSVGTLWTSDQHDADVYNLQRKTDTRNRHPFPGGI
jgi:hypothetical protein